MEGQALPIFEATKTAAAHQFWPNVVGQSPKFASKPGSSSKG